MSCLWSFALRLGCGVGISMRASGAVIPELRQTYDFAGTLAISFPSTEDLSACESLQAPA